VPFFIRWPAGGLDEGKDVARLAAHLDVLPTLVELCGLNHQPKNPMDGRSLAPLLRGSASEWPDRVLFVHVQREEIPPKWKRSAVLTERWRLVNGVELYDIKADPGQQTDLASEHPGLVEQLRAEYERWWQSLEPRFSEYGWIVVGSEKENPALITCHDWHAPEVREIPWHQDQVKRLPRANGYWMIEVARAGRYEFTLRHRPEMARFPLQATQARIRVGKMEARQSVPPGAVATTLRLELEPGRTRMETWLEHEGSGESRGAFFVSVRRVDM
jgi:hypothetical protein